MVPAELAADPSPLQRRLRSTAFGVRDFRFLWLAQVFRGLVVWMQSLALPWLMLQAGGSALDIGAAGAIQFLPSAILSPLVGAAIGISDKRRILLVTQTATAATIVLLALVGPWAGPQRSAVYLGAFVLGLVGAVDNPVRHALVGQLVPGHLVTSAVGLNSTIFAVTRVIGPSIAGMTIVAAGMPLTLASMAVASSVGVLVLRQLRPDRIGPTPEAQAGLGLAFRDGLAYVFSDQVRTLILGSLGISVTVVGAVQAVLPVLVISVSESGTPETGAAVLGLMFTAIGVGALMGSLAFGLVATAPSLRATMAASVFLSLAVVMSSLVEARLVVLTALGIYGLLSSVAMTLLNSRLQRATSDAYRARVMSLYVAVYAVATALGSFVGGFAAEVFGPRTALTVIGGCGATICLVLILRARRTDPTVPLAPTG